MPKLRFLGRENDPIFQVWFGAFVQELALLGWSIGHNVRVDARWATSNAADIRRHATELVALIPDVILAYGASTVAPELQVTRAGPIVFPVVGDPVSAGFVDSLARPGGNVTGFMTSDPAQGKCSKTGDFDVNGEESGSEVFRSPFSRAQCVLQCNNRLA